MQIDALITVADRVIGAELDGEYVMLDPDSGHYYGLNEVGTIVWRCLSQPRRLQDLVGHVCERFDVTPAQCLIDVSALVRELSTRGLVTVADAPTPAAPEA